MNKPEKMEKEAKRFNNKHMTHHGLLVTVNIRFQNFVFIFIYFFFLFYVVLVCFFKFC